MLIDSMFHTVPDETGTQFKPPDLSEGNSNLNPDSRLYDLPLYYFEASDDVPGWTLAKVFNQYPLLPGALVIKTPRGKEAIELLGLISRHRFLEFLIRPQALELAAQHPVHVLYSHIHVPILTLSSDTPVLVAAQQALLRSFELMMEPILVKISTESGTERQKPQEVASAANRLETYRILSIQELFLAYWQIRGIETQVHYERLQLQMIKSQRMAGLGRLVDGVAHEILDPVSFIWGNLSYLNDYHQNIMRLVKAYEACIDKEPKTVKQLKDEIEFEFIEEDMPQILLSIRSGAERLKQLASSLQTFCHIDEVHPKPIDLHGCLDSILLLLKSQISNDVEIIKDYGNLPPISCYLSQLNQALTNILTTLINSLLNGAFYRDWSQEGSINRFARLDPSPLQIHITTRVCTLETSELASPSSQPFRANRWISIMMADNGPGLSPEEKQKILDSFSTQKRIEQETSLSISYYIVTAKHGGQFYLRSELGKGTEFEVLLPLV